MLSYLSNVYMNYKLEASHQSHQELKICLEVYIITRHQNGAVIIARIIITAFVHHEYCRQIRF